MYKLSDFGAALDGVTDDTAIFVNAVQVAASENVPLLIEGDLKFDPTQIVWQQQNQHIWHVSGKLRPTTTIEINDKIFHLRGAGGAGKGTFWRDYGCEIIPPPGEVPTIMLKGLSAKSVKNVLIKAAHIPCYLQDGAWVDLEACSFGGFKNALVIDDTFWVWVRDCNFSSNSTGPDGWTIHIGDFNGSGAYTGLLYFEDCTTKGRGLMFDNTIGRGNNKTRTVEFIRHTHEGCPAGEYTVTAKGVVRVVFDRFTDADPRRGALGTFNLPGVGLAYLQGFNVGIEGAKPDNLIVNGILYNDRHGMGERPGHQVTPSGLLFARPAWRMFSPSVSTGIGEPLDIAFAPSNQKSVSFTGGVTAPDGSDTAYTLTNTSTSTGDFVLFDQRIPLHEGDILIGGVTAKGEGSAGHKALIFSEIEGDADCVYRGGDLENAAYRSDSVGDDVRDMLPFLNWLPIAIAHQVVSHTYPGLLRVRLSCKLGGGISKTFWMPWLRVLRAADGYTWDDALRVISANPYILNGIPQQTTALPAHHMLLTGKGANRPSNPVAGCQWYDTTLGKPIWYDGTNWTDAAGTTV